jgi:pSer/pThr/pTyr-binding forkhead associated (FHA) protein
MVQLRIFTGQDRGALQSIKRLPCVIGRGPSVDLRLEQPGIWDRHLQLQLSQAEGITAEVLPGALATVNGGPLSRAVLHNGDLIQLGAVKLQFWLSETRQRSFRLRETLTWIALALLCVGQILLIYYLLR